MPTQGRDEEHRLPRTSCNVARGLTQRHWTMRSISAYGGMHHPTSGGSDQPPTKWKDTAMSRTASRYPDPTASTQADTEATQPGASVSLLRASAGRSACSSPSGRRLDWIPDREKPVVPEEIAAICSGCPLQPACLQWAVEQDEPGYWGGTTSTERQRIVRGMTLGELQGMGAQNRADAARRSTPPAPPGTSAHGRPAPRCPSRRERLRCRRGGFLQWHACRCWPPGPWDGNADDLTTVGPRARAGRVTGPDDGGGVAGNGAAAVRGARAWSPLACGRGA